MEIFSGRIFFVDLEKKFGFIKPLDPILQARRVHFRLKDCQANFQVRKGALVEFQLSLTESNHADRVFAKAGSSVFTEFSCPPPFGNVSDKKQFQCRGNALHILPADHVPKFSNLEAVEGVVVYLNPEREFGKIKPKEGGGQVTFQFAHVLNRSNQELIIRNGFEVLFTRNLKNASKAFRVLIGEPNRRGKLRVCGHPWENSDACRFQCKSLMDCGKHPCTSLCGSDHDHNNCTVLETLVFPKCDHSVQSFCKDDYSNKRCKQKCKSVMDCGMHTCSAVCGTVHSHVCKLLCMHLMDCNDHRCPYICGTEHSHNKCLVKVSRTPTCGHSYVRDCWPRKRPRCEVEVSTVFDECGHQFTKKCYQKSSDIGCKNVCEKLMSCSLHKCRQKCGKLHSHLQCDVMINYKLAKCAHLAEAQKKCSETILHQPLCKTVVTIVHPDCRHEDTKECWQKSEDIFCSYPCQKSLTCGHLCRRKCGEDCKVNDCDFCAMEVKQKVAEFKRKAEQAIKECELSIQRRGQEFYLEELDKNGPSAAEFMAVADKVLKYVQPMHNWHPDVKKIEKVHNLQLERKFEKAKLSCHGTHIDAKFHGTNEEGIQNIPREGFRAPVPPRLGKRPRMFGNGIYFATDSSKSAQDIYTQGSQKLLLCEVILGKAKIVTAADPTLNLQRIRAEGCDSVFAPRNTKGTGGVLNDEFVIFDPDQAFPKYIIHYIRNGVPSGYTFASPTSATALPFKVSTIEASRKVNLDDPNEPHRLRASEHFYQVG